MCMGVLFSWVSVNLMHVWCPVRWKRPSDLLLKLRMNAFCIIDDLRKMLWLNVMCSPKVSCLWTLVCQLVVLLVGVGVGGWGWGWACWIFRTWGQMVGSGSIPLLPRSLRSHSHTFLPPWCLPCFPWHYGLFHLKLWTPINSSSLTLFISGILTS